MVYIRIVFKFSGSLGKSVRHYFRTIPSPGALYPLEVYAVVINVTGVPSGLYHYHVVNEELELLKSGDLRDELYTIFHDQSKQLESASVVVITTGVFQRVIEKYGKGDGDSFSWSLDI